MANAGVTMAGLGFVLTFIGVVLLIGALAGIAKTHSFLKCSESITGKVGNKYVHVGKNRRHYSMDILYRVDGKEYKRSVPASLSEHKTLVEGDLFEVKYKPDHPEKIIRADSLRERSAKKERILLGVSAAMTVIGVALILITVVAVRM